jgi:hypothetical protein
MSDGLVERLERIRDELREAYEGEEPHIASAIACATIYVTTAIRRVEGERV